MVSASLISCQHQGVLHLFPYKASNGDIPMLEWKLLLCNTLISVKCSSHAFLKTKTQAPSMSSSVWIVHSVWPSIPGWKVVLKSILVPNASCSLYQNPAWNFVYRSETMELGTPCRQKIPSRYAWGSWSKVQVSSIARKCANLVNLSAITQMALFFPLVFSSPTPKSMNSESYFHLGTSNGCRSPACCWCSAFTRWQVKHLDT